MVWARCKDILGIVHALFTFPCGFTLGSYFYGNHTPLGLAAVLGGSFILNMVWLVLWEAWYAQGKFFNVVPYPKMFSLPTWLIIQTARVYGFFDKEHPFYVPITLKNWNRWSTALTRRFDLAFWAVNFWMWMLIYLTIRMW